MKEFLLDLANKYEEKYKQWYNDNPGYVMNNWGIKADVCKRLAEKCNTIEDIIAEREKSLTKYTHAKGTPNGHWVAVQTCNEILKLIKENEIQI